MKFFNFTLVLFSLAWIAKGQAPCSFSLSSHTYDVCPFSTVNSPFIVDTIIDGNVSFSLGSAKVPSCTGGSNVWGTLRDGYGNCCNIATQDPTYTLQDSSNSLTGGLSIVFPAERTPAGDEGFQIKVLLHCGPEQTNMTNDTFSIYQILGDATSDVSTIVISGSSNHGCAETVGCPPQKIGTANYKLCALNQSIFNITDPLGGHLAFNLGGTPRIHGCSTPFEGQMIFGNYYTKSGYCISATNKDLPLYSLIDSANPNAGLKLYFDYPHYSTRPLFPTIYFTIYCDPLKTDPAQIQPSVSVDYKGIYLIFQVTASSAYACPVS